ncbi:hypothetical protein KCTC32516_00560 [Polaribacter huanghezhanensis]|uniref:hypothetical protein n=1 Tax=Polaribacter huanghezhanensis TaxID=1354726 RepID=UPI0026485096|nr:hypothetical protein [Polaribacter huanghezhanensis]WKD85220.1 hypothetical protein KCTC32516_00560 [Polaribacter huanghezhanensis]
MNIKQRKLILHFLEMLEKLMTNSSMPKLIPDLSDLQNFLTRDELIEIALWICLVCDKSSLARKSDAKLLKLIGNNRFILSYTIKQWKAGITATPTMSQEEVYEFFDHFQLGAHYLRDKPVEYWDEYDRSNYYSILFKHGKTRRVFAIFTTDVDDKDKYAVTTKPSFFFDTKQEAEIELLSIIAEKKFKKEELKIMSLWKIN